MPARRPHRIERDLHWQATHPIGTYARAGWKAGRIVTDRASLDAVKGGQ